MKTLSAKKPRIRHSSKPPEGDIQEAAGESNIVQEDGHLLLKSLDVKDWLQALHDDRESRIASLADLDKS